MAIKHIQKKQKWTFLKMINVQNGCIWRKCFLHFLDTFLYIEQGFLRENMGSFLFFKWCPVFGTDIFKNVQLTRFLLLLFLLTILRIIKHGTTIVLFLL
jgi:hypothetical protein